MLRERGAETAELSRDKRHAAAASVAFNVLVSLLKLVAALVTGSVSLLSDAVHSFTDLIASSLTFVSVRVAAAPPDEDHPFGHGKIESLTGFGEGIMVLAAVILIAVEAVKRLMNGHELGIPRLSFGLGATFFCSLAALGTSLYVLSVAKKTSSPALTVNANHLRIDFITSLGVFAGLSITKITGQPAVDPVIAIGLALWMSYGAIRLCTTAFQELLDHRLPEEEIARICAILDSDKRLLSYHRLRTRRSGSVRNIDLHIVLPREWTVVDAHQVADELEKRIMEDMAPAEVVIHVDPFDEGKVRASG
ncbi:MAG TPA: cation diffusion facilitator family transporter [Fimbriimonadaceae bacterium]